MSALTIHEAATSTGWSPRMLRYIEQLGLVTAPRSPAGYRLYGPAQLQRLRTLRELLERHGASLAEVGFALRLRSEDALRDDLDAWFTAEPERPVRSAGAGMGQADHMPDDDWLAFEQDKHQQLLSSASRTSG